VSRYLLPLILIFLLPAVAQEDTDSSVSEEVPPEPVVIPASVVEELRKAKSHAEQVARDVRSSYSQAPPAAAPSPMVALRPTPSPPVALMDSQDRMDACLRETEHLRAEVAALKDALRSVAASRAEASP